MPSQLFGGAGLAGLVSLCAAALASPVPDGLWRGELACSGNLLNGSPAYQQPVELGFKGGAAEATWADGQTREDVRVLSASDGVVLLRSHGVWLRDASRHWTIGLQGRFEGGELRLEGRMHTREDGELVRERCTAVLRRADAASAGIPDASPRLALESPVPSPPQVAAAAPTRLPTAPASTFLPIRFVGAATPEALSTHPATRKYPGIAAAFPEWLMPLGQPWAYRHQPTAPGRPLRMREPNIEELRLLERAAQVVAQREVKLLAFVEGDAVVGVVGREGLRADTLLPSASISKTVTALGFGTALCDGRIGLDTRLHEAVVQMQGTPMGSVTLRQLLSMQSGSAVSGHQISPAETQAHFLGAGSLPQLLTGARFTQTTDEPGRRFAYKSVDPYWVALAVQARVARPFTQWLEQTVFGPAGLGDTVVLDTDRQGNFLATSGVRLSLSDWIRLAIWVREQRAAGGCLGAYLGAMGERQTPVDKIPGVNGWFGGYGFFTWTHNESVPNSVWAVGHFGQRIAWSTDRRQPRVFLSFGFESDAAMSEIYPLARDWLRP